MLGGLVAAVRAWADGAGAAGVFIVAVLDSSALALPNATDALIMYLTVQTPSRWWYYALIATVGAVVGSLPLYVLAQRGGEAVLARRLSGPRAAAAVAWYRRSAFTTIAVASFTPPPMPLKPFVLLAGATGLGPWRVAAAITLGRGGRHAIETLLAMRYRAQAALAVEQYGATGTVVLMGVVGAVVVVAYFWHLRGQTA